MIDISSGKRCLTAGGATDARSLGLESDVEMVLAGEPVARRVGKDLAHHGAQRVLHQKVVADEIGRHEEWVRAVMQELADRPGHCNLRRMSPVAKRKMKWRLLLPGASGPRLEVQTPRT